MTTNKGVEEMKKIIWVILLVPFVLYIAGCGSSPENKTGTELVIDSITPMYDGKETNDVDVFQDRCPDGDLEIYKKHTAMLQIENKLLPGATGDAGGWVEVEYYEVDYQPLDNTLPKPDPIVFAAKGLMLEAGATSTIEIDLVPIDVKMEIATGLLNLGREREVHHYNATVTVWAKNKYGDYLTASKTVTLNIADFDNCQ